MEEVGFDPLTLEVPMQTGEPLSHLINGFSIAIPL